MPDSAKRSPGLGQKLMALAAGPPKRDQCEENVSTGSEPEQGWPFRGLFGTSLLCIATCRLKRAHLAMALKQQMADQAEAHHTVRPKAWHATWLDSSAWVFKHSDHAPGGRLARANEETQRKSRSSNQDGLRRAPIWARIPQTDIYSTRLRLVGWPRLSSVQGAHCGARVAPLHPCQGQVIHKVNRW